MLEEFIEQLNILLVQVDFESDYFEGLTNFFTPIMISGLSYQNGQCKSDLKFHSTDSQIQRVSFKAENTSFPNNYGDDLGLNFEVKLGKTLDFSVSSALGKKVHEIESGLPNPFAHDGMIQSFFSSLDIIATDHLKTIIGHDKNGHALVHLIRDSFTSALFPRGEGLQLACSPDWIDVLCIPTYFRNRLVKGDCDKGLAFYPDLENRRLTHIYRLDDFHNKKNKVLVDSYEVQVGESLPPQLFLAAFELAFLESYYPGKNIREVPNFKPELQDTFKILFY